MHRVVNLLIQISADLKQSGQYSGLLILVDELGKSLEFASRNPESGDIFILQQLAEAARPESGLALITILHQSFERYAAGLPTTARDEWAKIQGRFVDIAFQESPEQFMDLIARAITRGDNDLVSALHYHAKRQAAMAYALDLCPPGLKKDQFSEILVRCAPLHPLTVFILARLCKKFGQNQRSLFAFLTSREADSFLSFLDEQDSPSVFFKPADFYDYLAKNVGSGLAVGENATKWAEIEGALARCTGGSIVEINLIKTIGLLHAIGSHGKLKASAELLEYALGVDHKNLHKGLQKLIKASIIVFRRHSDSFALWQGSDVDLEARAKEARKRIDADSVIPAKLNQSWLPRPIVARRHSYVTGTLRYFSIRFVGAQDFISNLHPDGHADGLILYCLPNSEGEYSQLIQLASGSLVRENPQVLVAIPDDLRHLKAAVEELEALNWIEKNTSELNGDPVARRELRGRKTVAESRVSDEVSRLFLPGLNNGHTVWYHRGLPQPLSAARSLTVLLSDICDIVYSATPRLRNELINRRTLSSAAAAARRNLIDRMITLGNAEKLAIEGTPPEMSMYESILRATKIHSFSDGTFKFKKPEGDEGLVAVWERIEKYFEECELRRRSVSDLFELLQSPPFGLKMGLIPVIFSACALSHDTEVAFYENDAFVPELSVEIFERLLRSPDKFKIRKYSITGVRREVFLQFASLISGQTEDPRHLVSVVRPLFRFVTKLPLFTRQTRALSLTALAIREALFSSKEPDALLFDELPRACGFESFTSNRVGSRGVSEFFTQLKAALNELQRAYDELLISLQTLLSSAFNTAGSTDWREILRFRATRISQYAVDPRLRALIHHLADDQLDDVLWIEAIGSFVVGKPPRSWTDADRAKYEVVLSDQVRSFKHLEALVFENGRQADHGIIPIEILRIGVADISSSERETVVSVQACDRDRLTEAVIGIEEALDAARVSEDTNIALAALALVSKKLIEESAETKISLQPRARGKDSDA